MNPVLETPRLVLCEMSLADLDFVAAMLADPQVMRFYPGRLTREESEEWVRRQMRRYTKDGHGLWLVKEKSADRPVGQVGLIMQQVDDADAPEIGYLIHRPFWRQGFGFEAARATRDYAFDTLGIERVISLIRPENVPSRGVAHKLGMKPGRRLLHKGLDHIVFSMTSEDRTRTSSILS